jgi:RHS repeat-associated protein
LGKQLVKKGDHPLKKLLVYLLILFFLVNIPIPAMAQNNDFHTEQNTGILNELTQTDGIADSESALPKADNAQTVSGKTYEAEGLTIDPLTSDLIQLAINQEPPIKNQIIVIESHSQSSSVEDFVYGHSAYYDILKKNNRLDLWGKIPYKEQTVSSIVYDEQSVSDEVYQNEYVTDDNTLTKQDQSVSQEVYGDETEKMLLAMAARSSEDQAFYNTLVGPSVTNGVKNEQYSVWGDMEEIVSPQTGDLTVKQTDIKLPGRNGLDLTINRIYQSSQSMFGDRRVSGNGIAYNDYSTYYLNRYALGMGWAFGFPSVQVEQHAVQFGRIRTELYYHTGGGPIYHVDDSAGTYSHLEDYYQEDCMFNSDDTGFSNGQVTSKYSFITADQTKRYFASDGRLLGIVDRFGNQITFKHTEKPVTNIAPNNDFEYADNRGEWFTQGNDYLRTPYSYDRTFGKDDTSSIKFSGSGTKEALSCLIPVLPNTEYKLSGYIYNQLTSGSAQLGYNLYDENGYLIQNGTSDTSLNNVWEYIDKTITTNSDARFAGIRFTNSDANGTSWIDKVRFDRAWPLISEITDSIGRKITFTYNDTLYEEDPSDGGTITINVKDPSLTNEYNLTYTRGIYDYIWSWADGWREQRRFPRLFSYNDIEQINYYYYDFEAEKYDFEELFESDSTAWTDRPLLSKIYLRNSRVMYEYEKTTKYLGDDGFYDTHRISGRYEQKKTSGYAGTYYRRTYSYGGICNGTEYDNETGYPGQWYDNPDYLFTSAMEQDNGLTVKATYKGDETYEGQLKYIEEQYNNSSGDKEITCYEEYDNTFLDSPTKIRTEQYNANNDVNTLYKGYTYNDWGGVASQTEPLTEEQWGNATVKNHHTTSYTYDPTYKFLASKTYYQTPERMLTESTGYDATGRIASTINAKGETAGYLYEDAAHPGNLTRLNTLHSDGRTTRTDYDYAGAYYAFPTAITNYYTEDGVQKSGTISKSYEFVWGNVVSEEDAMDSATSYSYDLKGRVDKITYPASTGQSGNYVVEDIFEYANVYLNVPNIETPQWTFRVRNYRTKNGAIFSNTYSYYDDHGNLLYTQYYDYDRGAWVPVAYNYNSYGQLIWTKDANVNETDYLIDEWDRLKRVTDPQGNYYAYDYDIFNRTRTTTFVPLDTGTAENHYVETSDQWGRTTSRKGFPDGPGGPTVVEEKYEYDLVGNLTKLTDANNNATQYAYDALNRLNKITNPLGEVTDYDYDRLGDLTQIIQYQGTTAFSTINQYSERGALVSSQPPAGQPVTYKYNANGQPVEINDASGKITTTQYYPDNKLAEKRANQDRINYYYSPLGGVEKYQPVNDATGNGEALTYSYYSSGLVKLRAGVGFQYDLLGNRTKVTDPFGFSTDYQYNNLNRLTAVNADDKNYTYEYYGNGMVKAVNYPQLAGGTSLRAEYTYDNINRLTTMKNLVGGQIITQYSYGYDNNGNITSVTENGQTTNYTYDALNRLTGIQRPDGEQLIYQYDTRGNRSLASANDKGLDGFIPGSFSYNNWDQLAAFTTGGTTCNYSYDPEGLRNIKITPSGSTRYHYDTEGRLITESSYGVIVTARTIWGKQALARKVSGVYYYYLYNGHGDVTQVIDQNGNIVDSYTYDEWGNILSRQEQLVQPLKYAGEYYDDESGLYYLRARYYDPTIGRFISRDSVEGDITNPLSLNLYTYVTNNPLIYVDPAGHAAYQIGGLNLAPTFTFDPGFVYDPNAKPTAGDYASWIYWGTGVAYARVAIGKDAAKMYKHYRDNTGTSVDIDLARAYKEDSGYKEGFDNEIGLMQNLVNASYSGGAGTSFEIIGGLQKFYNGTSENWQKTIGAFYSYGYGQVTIDPSTGTATMVVTFYMEDMYNFNPGQADIASGTLDAVNGRFAQLGWAKEFKTYGSMTKTVTWNINNSSSVWTEVESGR